MFRRVTAVLVVLCALAVAATASAAVVSRSRQVGLEPAAARARASLEAELSAVEAKLATLDSFRPDLAAERAKVDELRRQLGGRKIEVVTSGGEEDHITVIGHGRAFGPPNVMTVQVGVRVSRPSVGDAVSAANESMQRVLSALRQRGVGEKDVQTRLVSVWPEYPGTNQRAYTAHNSVEARIRDVGRAGEILASSLEAGGNDVVSSGVTFRLEDNGAYLEGAREAAMSQARSKAEHYAKLAGRKLGKVLSVSETVSQPLGPQLATKGTAASAVPISPGESEVAALVIVSYELD